MENENEKLISIEEFIARAKRFGVDFGNGDPKNRLRYYVKEGLLPHAQRKSFNGSPPNGAYLEKALEVLIELDKKLKAGKSVQEIKREKEEKVFEKKSPEIFSPYSHIYDSRVEHFYLKKEPLQELFKEEEAEEAAAETEKKETVDKIFKIKRTAKERFSFFVPSVLKFIVLILIFSSAFLFANAKINFTNLFDYFMASVGEFREFAQLPSYFFQEEEEDFIFPLEEPYLTINAETVVNSILKVSEKITAPRFALIKNGLEGVITIDGITAEREYKFPDLSGTVCLTSGNCIGLGGEVVATDATANRLVKFISGREIGTASINDLYFGGAAISIDSLGNVGIGIENPVYDLHVQGNIQATGDICTDLAGGRCLSTLPIGSSGGRTTAGISGSGSANYFPVWTGTSALGNSVLYQSGENIGIGTLVPSQKLDVAGTIKMTGFQMPTNATSGYILASDSAGIGTWQPMPTGVLPAGTSGQTLRYNAGGWTADSFLYNTGSAVGIGTASTSLAVLTVDGSGLFYGPLTIDTSLSPQLSLNYDNANYLRFSVNGSQAELLSSKTMIINSLSGEIRLVGNTIDAAGAEVWGRTFISTTTDSTVRKSGEMVFRASVPIFKFAVPAQTLSASFATMTRAISPAVLNATLPDALPGAARKFAFLINFADNIDSATSSSWQIFDGATNTEFYFTGQDFSSLEEGVPHLSNFIDPPASDWQIRAKVPSGYAIRIFNIMLLVYDEIN